MAIGFIGFREVQDRARAYVEHHGLVKDNPVAGQATVTAEEAAELAAACSRFVAKTQQGIRQNEDMLGAIRKEIGDVVFTAGALCSLLGWSLGEVVWTRLLEIEQRGPEGDRG